MARTTMAILLLLLVVLAADVAADVDVPNEDDIDFVDFDDDGGDEYDGDADETMEKKKEKLGLW